MDTTVVVVEKDHTEHTFKIPELAEEFVLENELKDYALVYSHSGQIHIGGKLVVDEKDSIIRFSYLLSVLLFSKHPGLFI